MSPWDCHSKHPFRHQFSMPDNSLPSCTFFGDSGLLLLDEIPEDLVISKPGYRSVFLNEVKDDVAVEMPIGAYVEMTVDHPEWLPPGGSLHAYFKSPDGRTDYNEKIPVHGPFTFPLSDPGEYSVSLTLINPKSPSRWTVCETTFQLKEDGLTVVKLLLDEDVIRRALED